MQIWRYKIQKNLHL